MRMRVISNCKWWERVGNNLVGEGIDRMLSRGHRKVNENKNQQDNKSQALYLGVYNGFVEENKNCLRDLQNFTIE